MNPVRHLRALLATWRGRFIFAFLVMQLLLPLHYYTMRRDPHDERFAWRMFSPMRMAHCVASFTVDAKPVELYGEFHEAWIKVAERGRFVVIEDMAARLCKKHPGAAVRVNLDCTYFDREPRQYGGFDMCMVPKI